MTREAAEGTVGWRPASLGQPVLAVEPHTQLHEPGVTVTIVQVGKLRHKATRRVARGGRASRSGFASDVLKAQTRRRFGLGEAKVGGIADGETGQRPLRTLGSPRSLPLSLPSK